MLITSFSSCSLVKMHSITFGLSCGRVISERFNNQNRCPLRETSKPAPLSPLNYKPLLGGLFHHLDKISAHSSAFSPFPTRLLAAVLLQRE
jgi:hypothetical protein